jgi:outer membrane autotransporter protein
MGAGGPDLNTGNYDSFIMNGGEIGFVHTGAGADRVELFGGGVNGEIRTGGGTDRVDINGGELNGTLLFTDGGDDSVRLRDVNNLEEEEENFEINPDLVFDGGAGYDVFRAEDESEVRLDNEIVNFEFLLVEEQSVLVLTGEEYEFGDVGDDPATHGISVVEGSQLWFTGAEEVEATHIEIGGPTGEASLKVSNQYAAFDPGGMLMFGNFPAEGDDDDGGGDDEAGPVNTVLEIGPNSLINNGTVGTLNGIVGDTVTVTGGPYIAASATAKMVIDTQLGGSNSPTDRFNFTFAGLGGPVQGSTTTIYVNNVGGIGAFTGKGPTDGIVIVSAPAGFAPNAFQLGVNQLTGKQEVLAGAFSYRLFNSPTAALLQSDILDQVPGYAIVSSVAQRYASAGLGTLYKRMGEVRLGRGDGKTIGNAGAGMWVRGFYNDSDVSPETGFAFSQENQGVMGGADIDLGSSAGGHFLAGAFGGYGTANAGTSATIWGVNSPSTVDLNAYTFGFYGSYYDVGRPGTGLYVDGVFKVDITDFEIASAVRASSASTDGYTSTVSGETGYGFNLGGNLTLQPQAQLSYISVSNQNYQDNYGVKVGSGVAESLVGRASLQLQGNYGSASGGWFAPYAIASILSDFLGDNETAIGRTPFKNDMGLTWYEAGGGVTAELGEFVSLYGSAEYSFGDIEGWGGTGGVKARW